MKKFLVFFLLGIFFLSSCASKTSAEELSVVPGQLDDICGVTNEISAGIMTHDPWVNVARQGEDTESFLWIHNHSIIEDNLLTISSDVASRIEIHKNEMTEQGELLMLPQPAIDLPAKFMVELVPGAYHLMLIGLTRDLNVGEEITLTLHFENFTDVTATIPVKDW